MASGESGQGQGLGGAKRRRKRGANSLENEGELDSLGNSASRQRLGDGGYSNVGGDGNEGVHMDDPSSPALAAAAVVAAASKLAGDAYYQLDSLGQGQDMHGDGVMEMHQHLHPHAHAVHSAHAQAQAEAAAQMAFQTLGHAAGYISGEVDDQDLDDGLMHSAGLDPTTAAGIAQQHAQHYVEQQRQQQQRQQQQQQQQVGMRPSTAASRIGKRRENHNAFERRRRAGLTQGFERLRSVVPGCELGRTTLGPMGPVNSPLGPGMGTGERITMETVLRRAADYIERILDENQGLKNEIARLRGNPGFLTGHGARGHVSNHGVPGYPYPPSVMNSLTEQQQRLAAAAAAVGAAAGGGGGSGDE